MTPPISNNVGLIPYKYMIICWNNTVGGVKGRRFHFLGRFYSSITLLGSANFHFPPSNQISKNVSLNIILWFIITFYSIDVGGTCDRLGRVGWVTCDRLGRVGWVTCDRLGRVGWVTCDRLGRVGWVTCDRLGRVGWVTFDRLGRVGWVTFDRLGGVW